LPFPLQRDPLNSPTNVMPLAYVMLPFPAQALY
jgi:hypothetical protein